MQSDPIDKVYWIGNHLKNYKPQISHFLDGFVRFSPAISVLLYTDIILTVWNFRVFSIQICILYAYPSFWAWVAGSLNWARFLSKIPNAAPYPSEVSHQSSRACLSVFLHLQLWAECVTVVHTCIIYEQNCCLTSISHEIPSLKATFFGSCDIFYFILNFPSRGPAPQKI